MSKVLNMKDIENAIVDYDIPKAARQDLRRCRHFIYPILRKRGTTKEHTCAKRETDRTTTKVYINTKTYTI